MENTMKMYITAEEAAEILGVSRGYAYKIIRGLNNELKEKGLMDYIKFLGNRSDVNNLLQVFDVFILPSCSSNCLSMKNICLFYSYVYPYI